MVGCMDSSREHGARQGDPMSPYLFVLVMEVLHMILQQLIEQDGEFQYHWRCKDLKLFQLSFADDLLLFCKADLRSLQGSVILACDIGVPGRSSSGQIPWSPLFQHGFLADCKPLLRRLTAALKVYWAMAFIVPKGIINEMIKRLRTFLWKGTSSVVTLKWLGRLFVDQLRKGALLTNTGLLDKLSVVIKDGQWNWPMITDIACLEITYMLPPISEGPDRISWKSKDGSFNTSTAYELFHPPGPKVFWSSLMMGPFKIRRIALSFGLLSWGDCLLWINHGFTILAGFAFCVRMVSLRHTTTFYFHARFPAVALPSSDSRSYFHGPPGLATWGSMGVNQMAWKACG
ncbi:UNVERIFIED_CONTAM: hypothetical protein Sradi_5848200 [Sesamum radiatum]|uniref:Reverse transcriptase domain-containing protein n=1 Tax=Sesamum radiatum TaxID=300843 RepID=A0AAW2KQ22_SESRA